MASSRSVSREDEEEYLDQFDSGFMKIARMALYDSEDDANLSDDSEQGGKRSAIPRVSHHGYGTDLVEINEEKCGTPCYLTLTNGDRVDCVCAKDRDSCSRHRGKKLGRCPDGFYQKAPVKSQSSGPAGLLKAGCATHKSDPKAVYIGYTNHQGKRVVAMTQAEADRFESEGYMNPYSFSSPAPALEWVETGIRPNQQGSKSVRSHHRDSRPRSPS